jgi:hypothetical protein
MASTASRPGDTGIGVMGEVNAGRPGAIGVKGVVADGQALRGETTVGHAVHGVASSTSGYGGFFEGKVFTSRFHEMVEIAVPAAPGANGAKLFVRDNGSGKTQLCVLFSTGAVQVLATQP